jgi:3-hydroxyisobutyrate dehydrogenase-like beta-hydroxyacid dehydrogenase
MARRIIEAGYPMTLYARRPATLEPFGDTAAVATSPAELARSSELICICVVDDAGVDEVLTAPDGVLAGLMPGGIVAVHSTIHPESCRRLAELVADRGATLVDAPISGGAKAAAEGRLLVMVGGEDEAVNRCADVFGSYANHVAHLGPVGSGQIAKLVNNLLFTAHLATATGALDLARGLGIEPGPLAAVLAHGSGASVALGIIASVGGGARGFSSSGAALLQKDVRLIVDLAGNSQAVPESVLGPAYLALDMMGQAR